MTDTKVQIYVEQDPSFMENGFVVFVRDGGPCWMIDPGLPPHAERMSALVEQRKLTLRAILLTHAHADHIAGVDEVREQLGLVPLYLARQEWSFLGDPNQNLSAGLGQALVVSRENLKDLTPGLTLTLDDTHWVAIDSSGHSPGGRSLYCAGAQVAFSGDALFAGSIGRTDFPHSDHRDLISNIRANLMTLPPDTRVYPGHGPETTIETERLSNPFLIDEG
jgi:glyoxylase-like metal-dependent hydrolase (beta-lactamase superfamily II)